MNEQIAHYMSLRYSIELTPDPDGGYVAENPDLSGCVAQGETPDEAVAALEKARRLWIKVRLEDGLPVPEPIDVGDYSGKFVLRVPRTMHAELARLAVREGVSLNHYVSTALAQHVGAAPWRSTVETVNTQLRESINDLRLATKQTHVGASTDLANYWSGLSVRALLGAQSAGKASTFDMLTSCFRSPGRQFQSVVYLDPEEEGIEVEMNPSTQRLFAQGSR